MRWPIVPTGRFVIVGIPQSRKLIGWIEGLLEGRFRLTVDREKTRIVKLRQSSESLDFLGFTLRSNRDRFARGRRYLQGLPDTHVWRGEF